MSETCFLLKTFYYDLLIAKKRAIMSKRPKKDGILYTPLPDLFIDGVTKVNPRIGRSTRDSCLVDREKALYAQYGLERPTDLDPATRELIRQMAIKLKFTGFMDRSKIKKLGQPEKWLSCAGVVLVKTAEKYKAKYPKMTWINIMKKVKKDISYTGTPENLYARYIGILNNPLSHASIIKARRSNSLTSEQKKKLLEIESEL